MKTDNWVTTDSAKLAMKKVVRICDLLTLPIPENSSFLRRADNPRFRRWVLHKLGQNIYSRVIGAYGRAFSEKPTLITDKEWDHLIVLDACRYDTFVHVWHQLVDSHIEVPYIISPGSDTFSWVKANLVRNPDKGALENVVWVTANPIASKEFFQMHDWTFPLADCVSVWRFGWDEELDTVGPWDVVKAVREFDGFHDRAKTDRRFLIHFLQPHAPFIGDPSGCIDRATRQRIFETHEYHPGNVIWWLLRDGEISLRKVKKAYEANVQLALKLALKLVKVLAGRVVITADHGNLFGEYGLLHHPPGVHVPELVKVPWFEIQGGREQLDLAGISE